MHATQDIAHLARRWSLGIALFGLFAIGCGGPEGPLPDPLPGALEIGTVTGVDGSGFAAVADGTELTLTPGAQGGFHIWVNVRVSGLVGEHYLEWDARRVADDVLVSRAIPQYLDVSETAMEDWWENPIGMPSFMCPTPLGVKVFDEELYFDVRVVDEDEQTVAEDTLLVVARCPDGMQADFCREICSDGF